MISNLTLIVMAGFLVIIIGILAIIVVLLRVKHGNNNHQKLAELNQAYFDLNTQFTQISADYKHSQNEQQRLLQEINILDKQNKELKLQHIDLCEDSQTSNNDKKRLVIENETLKSAYLQLANLITELKYQMNNEFSNLKTLAINELNERADNSLRKIGQENVVLPLQEYFKDLQTKIIELATETKLINSNSAELNMQAKNLALALTKDGNKKDDFSEIILTNILESVGLQKYISYSSEEQICLDNKQLIPDVIIKLPHNRAVVVESKNIIKSYYDGIAGGQNQEVAILAAIKLTIDNLTKKDYLAITEKSLGKDIFDYAIMFIPNEALFNLIIEEDQKVNGELLRSAYAKKIFIAGPSTVLVLLGMIERSWDIFQVEERAEKIIQLARELSDKFRSSLQLLADLGSSLRQTGAKYDEVIKSLDNGTGSSSVAKLEIITQLSGDKLGLVKPAKIGTIIHRHPSSVEDEIMAIHKFDCED